MPVRCCGLQKPIDRGKLVNRVHCIAVETAIRSAMSAA
jgi:hypothetical protein